MRGTRIIFAAVLLSLGALLFASSAAFGQTAYPGTPTTVAPQPTVAEINLGPLEPGAVVNVSECNFQPNSTVNIVVRPPGTTLASVVADAKGCIVVRIEVLPTLVALGHSPLHPLAATGLAATANKVQVRINGQTVTVGPYGTAVDVISTGTGNNGAARTVTAHFTVVKRGTVTRSGLVRTGTAIAQWSPLALGLVGIGYLMVLASKRRRNADAA